MPKSKRNKTVDLSKTKKHGLEGKKELYKKIQSNVENYAHVFVFAVNDMRNTKMKNVREQWKHSRFCIGKNKVMAMALGRTPEEEYRLNLHKIGQMLVGERGLLFTNQSVDEVTNWFQSYSEGDYARSGNIATEDVILPEGPLAQFPHNLESYLRQLGLPTTLKKGVIHLVQEYVVCREGDRLSPETARVLKLLGYEMAEFRIKMLSVWSQDGSFVSLQTESCDTDSKENAASPQKSFMKEDFELAKDCLLLGDEDDEMEVAEVDSDSESKMANHIEEEAESKGVAEEPKEEGKELESINNQTPKGRKSSAKAEIESNDSVEMSQDPKEEPEPKQTKGKKSSDKTEIESDDDSVEVKENSGDVVEVISSDHEDEQESEKATQKSKKGNAKSADKEKQADETLENTNSNETEVVELEEEIQEPESTKTKSEKKSGMKTAKKSEKQTSGEIIDENAVLKLTVEKLGSPEKQKKFSPKMTRSRGEVAKVIPCDEKKKQETEKTKQKSKIGNSKSADKDKHIDEALEKTNSKEAEDAEMEVVEIQEPESKKAKSDSTVMKSGKKTAKKTEKQTSNESIDKDAVLKLTAEKLQQSAEKPKKFSPKMTRARAAATNKKIKTPEPLEITRSSRKRKM